MSIALNWCQLLIAVGAEHTGRGSCTYTTPRRAVFHAAAMVLKKSLDLLLYTCCVRSWRRKLPCRLAQPPDLAVDHCGNASLITGKRSVAKYAAPEAAGLWLSGAATMPRLQPRPSARTTASAPSEVCSATKFPSCNAGVNSLSTAVADASVASVLNAHVEE